MKYLIIYETKWIFHIFTRYAWTHGITPRKSDVIHVPAGGLTLLQRGVRTSLTFRKIRRESECHCIYRNCCDSQQKNSASLLKESADDIEKTHVYDVYNRIAIHFSDTRHKPWPNVLDFVRSFPMGSILVDVGCGNGKYIGHSSNVYNVSKPLKKSKLLIERNFHLLTGWVRPESELTASVQGSSI